MYGPVELRCNIQHYQPIVDVVAYFHNDKILTHSLFQKLGHLLHMDLQVLIRNTFKMIPQQT